MRLFKISEQQIQSLGDLLIEFPMKYQPLIIKCIDILKSLEEIKEPSLDKEGPA